MGNVIPTEPKDAYLGRIAAIDAGIPVTTPAFNVNRLCGSGLQAIISAAQAIQLGDASIAIGAGAESMSRGPFLLAGMRWGSRLGDASAIDYMNGVLHDPWQQVHMGITAENVAKRYGISRAQQDALALESQRRASRALAEQRFASQIVPIEVNTRTGTRRFDTDEHVRVDVTAEQLAGMRPVFDKAAGTVTAGNASASMTAQPPWCLPRRMWPASWACDLWRAWLAMPMRVWSPPTWASAQCRRYGWYCSEPDSTWGRSMSSRQTRHSPPRPAPWHKSSALTGIS